jgi:hypothetical protein
MDVKVAKYQQLGVVQGELFQNGRKLSEEGSRWRRRTRTVDADDGERTAWRRNGGSHGLESCRRR